jgi:hypothetical protein
LRRRAIEGQEANRKDIKKDKRPFCWPPHGNAAVRKAG